MDQNIAWSMLPDNVLIHVFEMLNERDLAHASSTCTRWRRMFYEPRFWRTVNFKLKSPYKNHVAVEKKLQNHLENIGSLVQHVTIICPIPRKNMVKRLLADWIKVILDTLAENNLSILSFKLENLRIDKHWKDLDYAKIELINSLCQFIETQTCLQTLVLSEALLPTTFGHMVMSSLARSPSVETLQQLDIFYLYAFCLAYNRQHTEHIRWTLFKFTQLKEITINYSLLKAIEVQKLCQNLQHSLEKLQLKTTSELKEGIVARSFQQYDDHNVYTYDEDDDEDDDDAVGAHVGVDDEDDESAIASESWLQALRFCPGLIVSVEMDLVGNLLEAILAPTMPVSHLTIKGVRKGPWDDEDEVGINGVLRLLCRFSLRSLKTVTFIVDTNRRFLTPGIEISRAEVINFLVKYPTLTSVQISAGLMSNGLLTSVNAEMMARFHLDRDILSIIG